MSRIAEHTGLCSLGWQPVYNTERIGHITLEILQTLSSNRPWVSVAHKIKLSGTFNFLLTNKRSKDDTHIWRYQIGAETTTRRKGQVNSSLCLFMPWNELKSSSRVETRPRCTFPIIREGTGSTLGVRDATRSEVVTKFFAPRHKSIKFQLQGCHPPKVYIRQQKGWAKVKS